VDIKSGSSDLFATEDTLFSYQLRAVPRREGTLVNECPECSAKLKRGSCPECGWKPTVMTHTRSCGHCEKDRPVERAGQPETYACPSCGAISAWFCQQCGHRGAGVVVHGDGRRLCSSCRVAA